MSRVATSKLRLWLYKINRSLHDGLGLGQYGFYSYMLVTSTAKAIFGVHTLEGEVGRRLSLWPMISSQSTSALDTVST